MTDIRSIRSAPAAASGASRAGAAKAGASGGFDAALSKATEKTAEKAARPSVAQFMAATGADAKSAVDIIYKYGDWQLYMDGKTAPDLSSAQRQIAAEAAGGTRATTQGARASFAWLTPPEPAKAGAVVPRFHEITGKVTGISFVDGEGGRHTGTSLLAAKDEVARKALGYGVGAAGLDEFARRLGAADFASLDWTNVSARVPDKAAWVALYGPGTSL